MFSKKLFQKKEFLSGQLAYILISAANNFKPRRFKMDSMCTELRNVAIFHFICTFARRAQWQ